MASRNPVANAQGEHRREAIMTFLKEFHAEHGWMPSRAEISAAVGLAQRTINHHISILEEEGRLEVGAGARARALRILDDERKVGKG